MGNQIITIERTWADKDVIELRLPMEVAISRWHENSAAVEQGPLVYSLKIDASWDYIRNTDKYCNYFEVKSGIPWNYGLLFNSVEKPDNGFLVIKHNPTEDPWEEKNAPSKL